MATGSDKPVKDDNSGWKDYTQADPGWQDFSAPSKQAGPKVLGKEDRNPTLDEIRNDPNNQALWNQPVQELKQFGTDLREHPFKTIGKTLLKAAPIAAGFVGAENFAEPMAPDTVMRPGDVAPEIVRYPRAGFGGQRAEPIPPRQGLMLPAPKGSQEMAQSEGLGQIGAPRPLASEGLGNIPIPRSSHTLTEIPVRTPPQAETLATAPIRSAPDASPLRNVGPASRPAAESGSDLAHLPRPIGERQDMNKFLSQDSTALGKIPVPASQPRMQPWPVPRTKGVTFVPEPRAPFAGENEGYMASTPREDLLGLARMRKPGAGAQLQQLGKPIIYIPKEADIP